MSAAIEHVFVQVGELRMHAAVAGPVDGPAVVLCHGFPESWYSWRHQLQALGDAGYRVIAPDQRGYGQTDAPLAVEAYSQVHLVGDLVGLLDALAIGSATVVGHDWGAPVAWHAALMRPDLFPAVVGLSVPFGPRLPGNTQPTQTLRAALGDAFFYVLYFQEVGVAEAELDRESAARFAASCIRSQATSRSRTSGSSTLLHDASTTCCVNRRHSPVG